MAKIGREEVKFVKDLIIKRTDEITAECIQDADPNAGWINTPKIKATKAKNQTCYMMVKDMSQYIIMDQVLRWKEQYPQWRNTEAYYQKLTAGNDVPAVCTKPASKFYEWLNKTETNARSFFNWQTNKYDFRETWPQYILDFREPFTKEEAKKKNYRRLFNKS